MHIRDYFTTVIVKDCSPEIRYSAGAICISSTPVVVDARDPPETLSVLIVAMTDGGRLGNSFAPMTAPFEVRVNFK